MHTYVKEAIEAKENFEKKVKGLANRRLKEAVAVDIDEGVSYTFCFYASGEVIVIDDKEYHFDNLNRCVVNSAGERVTAMNEISKAIVDIRRITDNYTYALPSTLQVV